MRTKNQEKSLLEKEDFAENQRSEDKQRQGGGGGEGGGGGDGLSTQGSVNRGVEGQWSE